MSGETESTPVGQLLLARLLVAGDKGATGAEIRKALEPLVGHRWAGAALTEQLGQGLADLEAAGLVSVTRVKKTERRALTEEGRRRTVEMLGVDTLPAKNAWDAVKKKSLAALALGLPTPAPKEFSGEPGFKAALLKVRYGLPGGDFPKLPDALGALAWTLLGFEPGPKFNVQAVEAALILRQLGDPGKIGPKPNPGKEVTRLLAREVGARKSGTNELRLAALRHWVDGDPIAAGTVAPPPRPAPAPPAVVDAAPPLDLTTFARRVVDAARSSPSGRFGDNKVFVAHVWRVLQGDPAFGAMGPDGFKNRLAEANNARLIDLSRADMVEAMDPDDVRLSEVRYLNASFHFVRI